MKKVEEYYKEKFEQAGGAEELEKLREEVDGQLTSDGEHYLFIIERRRIAPHAMKARKAEVLAQRSMGEKKEWAIIAQERRK